VLVIRGEQKKMRFYMKGSKGDNHFGKVFFGTN
jgi:hypothetical protein